MRASYDVVVIGSGFGGATVACRSAQAGRSVAVLERGKRWRPDEFPRSIGQVSEAFWEEGRSHGFLEYLAFRTVDVIQGCGVGGGSLHYFNVNVRTAPQVFDDPAWPRGLDRATLDPYYDVAQDMLESAVLTPPAGRTELPARTEVFIDAARRAGQAVEQVPIAVFTGEDRLHPVGGQRQSACTYCGNCLYGCDIGAKQTVDGNYLALAERRHGAEVFPLHVVEAISALAGGGYEVRFRRLDDDPRVAGEVGTVRGAKVVVAAGALGSTELLLRCRDLERSLPRLPAAVGRRFSVNGEMLLARAQGTERQADPGLGPPITARTTVERNGHLMTIEDLGLPDSLLWFLEGAMPPATARARRLVALASTYVKRSLGLGGPRTRVSLEVDALVRGGRTPYALPFLGMGIDSSDGAMRLADGALDISWSPRRNRQLYREMEKAMTEISEAAGGEFVRSYLWRWPLRKVLTAHPLGGCAMGADRRSSVVDEHGEVWDHPGLYVVDGSVLPTALAVNPSLTIAAVAERASFWMTHGRDLQADDAATPVNR